jgi:hypothetical protein
LLCPCKNEWISPILNIDIGEAIGLLKALNWIYELQLTNVDFELDSQIVVTRFHGKKEDASEFGDVINDCKCIYNSHFTNPRVEFIRRQTNETAKGLARVTTSIASFHLFIDILTYISNIIDKEML